ncbi:Trp biosynthesis-associated membrane protein [Nocardioides sp. HDW12B]|uniref:Trp biosynthesis-associated membrane protein n=1 Tax=Nocardioides sp. HDW12B TaxID=2714939 RepID=UPI00140CF800|nr:Trp biosynthesis-associated membrane protein [Nocardioides sp. HDW12B]QIK66826.1 Trp biosynthesis-associated membrane protein [Nocardioides sp. HDW12B]
MPDAPQPTAAPQRERRTSGFGTVLLAGLATAGLGTLAAGRTWATAITGTPGPREVSVAGTDVAPVMLPLGLVALACWGAFLVLRTPGRRVVAVLGALAAAGGAAAALLSAGGATDAATDLLSGTADGGTSTSAWPWVGAVALAGCVVAFAVAFARCATYPQMSRRYDRDGATTTAATPADQWRAMDDGRDPTV